MERYERLIPKIKNDRGKRVFRSTLPPKIKESESDTIIISRAGDRLDLLANTFYGDSTLWWIIAQANINTMPRNGTLSVPSGLTIRIPADVTEILSEYKAINEVL